MDQEARIRRLEQAVLLLLRSVLHLHEGGLAEGRLLTAHTKYMLKNIKVESDQGVEEFLSVADGPLGEELTALEQVAKYLSEAVNLFAETSDGR